MSVDLGGIHILPTVLSGCGHNESVELAPSHEFRNSSSSAMRSPRSVVYNLLTGAADALYLFP